MSDGRMVVVGGVRYRVEDAKRRGLVADPPPPTEKKPETKARRPANKARRASNKGVANGGSGDPR